MIRPASELLRDADDLHGYLCCSHHVDHSCDGSLSKACWTCRIALTSSLRSFASSLAVGAALCAAWDHGTEIGMDVGSFPLSWHPGCGSPVPPRDSISGELAKGEYIARLVAEIARMRRVIRDAAEILRLNGLVATANAAEGL